MSPGGMDLASSRSFELSSTGCECISRSLCVIVEVVLLDVLDALIAVVAYGRERNSSLKCKGDPGVLESIPSQVLA